MWYYDDGLDYSKLADIKYIENTNKKGEEENNKILRCKIDINFDIN